MVMLQRHSGRTTEPAGNLQIVDDVLRSPGQPIDNATRAFMERRIGHDFSRVRVHTDARGVESAQAVNALAYTVGRDIVFGAGQYAPGTTAGKRLLAHELTHVAQQTDSLTLQRQEDDAAPPAVPPTNGAPAIGELEETVQPEATQDSELSPQETEDSELYPEPIEPLLEASYISEDLAPEEEPKEEGRPEGAIATASAGFSPTTLGRQIVPPDHPSEREAEAVSRVIVSGPEKGGPPTISHSLPREKEFIQRQIYWDKRNTLGWADFKGNPIKGSPFDASTESGFKMAAPKVLKEVSPYPPGVPNPCKIGKTTTTQFYATVSLDISPESLNVRALMRPAQSWVKPGKQSAALLAHEQGHFDITHVIAKKTEFAVTLWAIKNVGVAEKCGKIPTLNAAIKSWNAFGAQKAINKIAGKANDVLKHAQADYDNATGHGANAAAQQTWQGDINADLPNYNVF
jgi:hypothetical protein